MNKTDQTGGQCETIDNLPQIINSNRVLLPKQNINCKSLSLTQFFSEIKNKLEQMAQLIASSATKIQEAIVEDAPLGSLIYRTTSPKGVVYTPHKPINVQRKYRLRGWIRRTSFDHIPTGTYFMGALMMDYAKKPINGDGWCHYYFIKNNEGTDLTPGLWRYVEFQVGAGTDRPFPKDAKFLSLASVVNYDKSTGTYEFCGFDVQQLLH